MFLLYADESGSIQDPSQAHFVLAGISLFERTGHWIEQEMNHVARRFSPLDPYQIEFHGAPMRAGTEGWSPHPFRERIQAQIDVLETCIQNRHPRDIRLFGVVIRKAAFPGEDIAEMAFEQLCSRFDHYLARLYRTSNKPERGLIIFDKSATEQRIQTLAREFKYEGHTWGHIHNYAEVPVFLDSKASRLIQLADLVAYALFRYFERNDSLLFSRIQSCFDSEGGVNHGLYVRR